MIPYRCSQDSEAKSHRSAQPDNESVFGPSAVRHPSIPWYAGETLPGYLLEVQAIRHRERPHGIIIRWLELLPDTTVELARGKWPAVQSRAKVIVVRK